MSRPDPYPADNGCPIRWTDRTQPLAARLAALAAAAARDRDWYDRTVANPDNAELPPEYAARWRIEAERSDSEARAFAFAAAIANGAALCDCHIAVEHDERPSTARAYWHRVMDAAELDAEPIYPDAAP